jgi:type IV pilus assembly protein PilO
MADNFLTRQSLMGQLITSIVVALVIFIVFWWFYWDAAVKEQTQKATKLEGLRKSIQALEVTANKLPEFQREVALLEQKLETLKRILPPEKETPDLMKKVQYLAAQSNLNIRKFNPQPTVNKEFYQEWPIAVEVDGTYHNLGMFFDRVGRLSRLVNVGNLKVKSQQKQTASNTIGASCTATTFVYLETPPSPPPGRPGQRPAPPRPGQPAAQPGQPR